MDPPKEQDPDPEIIAGQPTLHETPPVARLADIMPTGYPDWANYDGAVDERTGVPLLEDKVKEGRGREMKRAPEDGIPQCQDRHYVEASQGHGLEDCEKQMGRLLPNDPHGVRSRRVAMEINPRDDVFRGTPPLVGDGIPNEKVKSSEDTMCRWLSSTRSQVERLQ